MSAPQKLTKKQKKGIAFRAAKSRHGDPASLEDNEVPVLEVQDLADDEAYPPALEVAPKPGKLVAPKSKEARKGKEKAKDSVAAPASQKKRKRDDAAADGEADVAEPTKDAEPKRKKTKGSSGAAGVAGDAEKGAKATQVKQRFILFVGALSSPLPLFFSLYFSREP